MSLDFETIGLMMTADASLEKKLKVLNEQIGVRNKEIRKMDEWKDIIIKRIAETTGDEHMQNFVKKTIDPDA